MREVMISKTSDIFFNRAGNHYQHLVLCKIVNIFENLENIGRGFRYAQFFGRFFFFQKS